MHPTEEDGKLSSVDLTYDSRATVPPDHSLSPSWLEYLASAYTSETSHALAICQVLF